MEKFVLEKHGEYVAELPFSYFSEPSYLEQSAYVIERNGEYIFLIQDLYYPTDFPAIFLPKEKENWENMSVTFTTEEQIDMIKKEGIEIKVVNPVDREFFYRTEALLKPNKKIRQRINQFEKNYKYKICHEYPILKIEKFYKEWKQQIDFFSDTFVESEESFFFHLHTLEKFNVKQVYIEIDGKLAGVAWGVEHQNGWVGLQLKVLYEYKGISRFLHAERAKLFADREIFTLGTGGKDPGITQFKHELGAYKEVEYFYILTGGKSN